ncbi:MAG: GNAT family N-acetyltransferase [Crenarchaeota archaeon]|nr:MAG: GNAT family N-acetyltransferase [Thermoproteota archaeon]RDJ33873.1 MAG: GNAT family N-acetyltransferase [Thermoproteota archaeon]RDJ37016.1 MAG: GNAT family N-acetyltransferase [Thermoproteota archaeon]RDJ37449.1 MAG: GNAT family N-acetyltransferase [Thermoproteota archaeon]
MTDSHSRAQVIVRTVTHDDIPKIVELQKASFPTMAAEGVYWKPDQLAAHLKVFPEGQFCAEYKGNIVGSCSSLIITLEPEYKEHTWKEACGTSIFENHDPKGDSLYGADVSTHPDYRRLGIATKIYNARKDLAIKLNLRRIIAGGRLFNYCDYAKQFSPEEYVKKVKKHEIKEPVLCFQLRNGFKFIKILPNYMKDPRSLNYATFIEWKNPHFKEKS